VPPAPVTNLLRATLTWAGYGESGTLTWWFAGSESTHSATELSTAAAAAVTQLNTSTSPSTLAGLRDKLSTSQTLGALNLYEYADSRNPATGQGTANVGGAGTGTTVHGLQTSVVLSLRTAQPGASFRGRQYLPGHGLGVQANTPQIPSATATAMALLGMNMGLDIRNGLQQSLSIDSLAWCVFSPTLGAVTPIARVQVSTVLETQRRREANVVPVAVQVETLPANPA
jgi:hypothetical protein